MKRLLCLLGLVGFVVVVAPGVSAQSFEYRTLAQVNVTWWDAGTGAFVTNGVSLLLYDELVPTTVSNFLSYAETGEYHFNLVDAVGPVPGGSTPSFAASGEWWVADIPGVGPMPFEVQASSPIDSELLANPGLPLSNTRGTVAAFSPTGGQITSNWMFNLTDNNSGASNFDGFGFTPFGEVMTSSRVIEYYNSQNGSFNFYTTAAGGMDLVDAIGNLATFNFDDSFTPDALNNPGDFPLLPVVNYDQGDYDASTPLTLRNMVFTSVIPIGITALKTDVNFSGQRDLNDIASMDSFLAQPGAGYLWQADMNDDGVVDFADRFLLFDAIGATTGDTNGDGLFNYYDRQALVDITNDLSPYSALADMDRNHVINSTDQALFDLALAQRRASGDINGDGQFTEDDINFFMVGWVKRNDAQPDLIADFDSSGAVNNTDFNLFLALADAIKADPGDMNHDGVVDVGDINAFNLVAFHEGAAYDYKADLNFDGVIDAADVASFTALVSSYVVPSDGPPLAGGGGGGTIPEPASLGLFGVGLAMLLRRRCRPHHGAAARPTRRRARPAAFIAAGLFTALMLAPAAFAGIGREVVHIDMVTYSPAHGGYISSRMDVLLYNDLAPSTVDNFKQYVTAGLYDWTVIHRNAAQQDGSPFVIQGGGFTVGENASGNRVLEAITNFGTIDSEWNPDTMSNTRGTLAMARVGTDANSATSQWFVNMADNTFLDYAGSATIGFTVFGRVIDANTTGGVSPVNSGMTLADAIAGLPGFDFGTWHSAAGEIPLVNFNDADYAAAVGGSLVPPDYTNFVWVTMSLAPDILIGDVSGDGLVNTEDINPFIAALTNPAGPYTVNADINQDGLVNTEDINPFIALLTASPAGGSASSVPEPAAGFVLLVSAIGLTRRRAALTR